MKEVIENKKWFAVLIFFMLCKIPCAEAQFTTKNNFEGIWVDAFSWTSGQPDPLTLGITEEIDVYGYITRQGGLSFANIGNNTDEIIIYDTLVVEGNMTFENNSISLTVESGGVLVVFGNFVANNKVDLENGGTMVITGDMELNGGNQDYVNNGGGLYVDGDITGNGDTGDADGVDQPSSNLNDGSSGERSLYNFIQSGGAKSLPITLSAFSAELVGSAVELQWTTVSEDNFNYFEIQRSLDGDQFEVIGTVWGQGSLNQQTDYSFVDEKPLYGKVYYRLNAIDHDGSFELFNVLQVANHPRENLLSIYPNPSNGKPVFIELKTEYEPSIKHLLILNVEGQIVFENTNLSDLDLLRVDDLLSGMYIIKYEVDNLVLTQRLLVN